jgi:hypothetical protein
VVHWDVEPSTCVELMKVYVRGYIEILHSSVWLPVSPHTVLRSHAKLTPVCRDILCTGILYFKLIFLES